MAEYDPADPSTWADSDPVGTAEMHRRLAVLGVVVSHQYLMANLTRQATFPKAGAWEINGGRWWTWGDGLAWFKDTGRA
jgi:hypothetical protein